MATSDDEKYMRLALAEAEAAAAADEVPVGAVVVCNGKVIARAHNLTETLTAGALAWSQIGRIVYGASDDKRGYHTMCANPFHPKTEVEGGILAGECAALITTFFRSKR